MSEEEIIEQLSEKISDHWKEREAELDKFLDNVNPKTPLFVMTLVLLAKAADLAVKDDWSEQAFADVAALAYEQGKKIFPNSEHIH